MPINRLVPQRTKTGIDTSRINRIYPFAVVNSLKKAQLKQKIPSLVFQEEFSFEATQQVKNNLNLISNPYPDELYGFVSDDPNFAR